MNAAIIGYGMAGRVFHGPIMNSVEEINLKKIYTKNEENQKAIKNRYPEVLPVSTLEEIFMDDSIELVVIASPNTSHYSLAREAILPGKHVIVDKPFTVTTGEADELIKLAKEKNRILSVYHNRRFESDYKTAKKVAESGLLGPIVECEIHMDRFRNYFKENAWREKDLPGSGIFYDLGSHMIDQGVDLFGLPKAITADLRKQRTGAQAVDNFEAVLHYDRIKVTLKAGMLVNGRLPRFILLGEEGSFISYGTDIQEEDLKNGFDPLNKVNWGVEPEALYGTMTTSIKGLSIVGVVKSEIGDYRDLYRNVIKAIKGEENLIVTPEQGRNTIRIIEKAIESSNNKKTVEIDGYL